MNISNPILRGFYPDPSVCKVEDKYYMVCSSFQYFPGVPLFESDDLINWTQIGHCLTRKSQIALENVNSSGGVFAPTIRYYNGRFYMTTTNDTTHQNFYVWTEDIYGEWSEPIFVDQGGIDPSFYFEDGRSYFMSNGNDDEGIPGIVQCEMNIKTGDKLSPSKTIWQGSGGRYLESPHVYRFNDYYYLIAAEGGTEYGHMVTYSRSKSIWGPYEGYPNNPVLTNRNLGGFEIQGVGHGDLIEGPDQKLYMLHLGFRQIGRWDTFHHLGREVFLTPVRLNDNGWFSAGNNGTTEASYDLDYLTNSQTIKEEYTFENCDWSKNWCYMRIPNEDHYKLNSDSIVLHGTSVSLSEPANPTFIGLRQKEFDSLISCSIDLDFGEAGITLYMDENHHYDFGIIKTEVGYKIIVRLCIGNIKSIESFYDISDLPSTKLLIKSDAQNYHFIVAINNVETEIGQGLTRYLSSEVAGGFTGVLIGLYAHSEHDNNTATFSKFCCEYTNIQ